MLNAGTKRAVQPYPPTHKCTDSLGEGTEFRRKMKKARNRKLAWKSKIETVRPLLHCRLTPLLGFHPSVSMSLKSRNAPRTNQRSVHVVLTAAKWQFAWVFCDEIFVPSRSEAEQIDHMKNEQALQGNAEATLRCKTVAYLSETIDYSGKIYSFMALADFVT